jgi:transposase InsO family protein
VIVLDGYSRVMLAATVAPSEASWAALMVLHTACLRYGAPQYLISDKGGAYISDEFEAVCQRLGIEHIRITSTQGESYLNLMETHFNIQRCLYDYQFALKRTPLEFEQAHQDFLQLYNTTAHQGLLKEGFESPIPLDVLAEAKGRLYARPNSSRSLRGLCFPV